MESRVLPKSGEWWKATIIYMKKDFRMHKQTVYYQCMKSWPEVEINRYSNPWTKPRRRGRPPLVKAEMKTEQLLFRTRKIRPNYGYVWKNVLIYGVDFPVYNNSNPTLKNPVSLVTLEPSDPPSWYNPSSSSGL